VVNFLKSTDFSSDLQFANNNESKIMKEIVFKFFIGILVIGWLKLLNLFDTIAI
jgi:hypothetical protein